MTYNFFQPYNGAWVVFIQETLKFEHFGFDFFPPELVKEVILPP